VSAINWFFYGSHSQRVSSILRTCLLWVLVQRSGTIAMYIRPTTSLQRARHLAQCSDTCTLSKMPPDTLILNGKKLYYASSPIVTLHCLVSPQALSPEVATMFRTEPASLRLCTTAHSRHRLQRLITYPKHEILCITDVFPR
jgi:hypothetical protein